MWDTTPQVHTAPTGMPPDQVQPNVSSVHRGANRSTKVAGKLKVLPEQPDVSTLATRTAPLLKITRESSSGTTGVGDGEDGDIDDDDDDDEPEDVEVSYSRGTSSGNSHICSSGVQPNLSNTRRDSQTRCSQVDKEKSQVVTKSYSICNSKVMVCGGYLSSGFSNATSFTVRIDSQNS